MDNSDILSSTDTMLLFVDASPSEVFFSDIEGKTVLTLVLYAPFDRRIKSLGQFKSLRMQRRREKKVSEFIDLIQNKKLAPTALSIVVEKEFALIYAKDFLKANNIVTVDLTLDTKINFHGIEIKYGRLLCLTWFTICMSQCSEFGVKIAGMVKCPNLCVMLDLLPGDNSQSQTNLKVVKSIYEYSELRISKLQSLKQHNVYKFGFGYGMHIEQPKQKDEKVEIEVTPMKLAQEFCMTDWICQCVLSKYGISPNLETIPLFEYLMANEKLKVMTERNFTRQYIL
ncbi:MAG TPA: hypothetical protein VK154_19665 [Chitinophagales bacterium]|nr:hypothetical protein [Chitinophagales bacterium]